MTDEEIKKLAAANNHWDSTTDEGQEATAFLNGFRAGEKQNIEFKEILQTLLDVLIAHETESLTCDRDGETYCKCVENEIEKAKKTLDK